MTPSVGPTIQMIGSARANRPGTLARLASLVSQAGGNILRSVNNTLPDGRFSLRLVVSNLSPEQCEPLYQAYIHCGVELESIEIT